LPFAHVMIFPLAWALAGALAGGAAALGAALLAVLALAFSTARGAWLGALAVAAALALVARDRRARLVLPACAVAAGLAFAVTPALRAEAAHMFSAGGANAGRVGIYRTNLDIVHERPVLGLGFGRYRTAAPPYYAAHPAADRRSHAHNNFLQMAAEAGLTGRAATPRPSRRTRRGRWRSPPPRRARGSSRSASRTTSTCAPRWSFAAWRPASTWSTSTPRALTPWRRSAGAGERGSWSRAAWTTSLPAAPTCVSSTTARWMR